MSELRQLEIDGRGTEGIKWIYFRSPEWSWEHLCGREGWLLYEPESGKQLAFFMTLMN